MAKKFTGYSRNNDLSEALANAISQAKQGLTTDFVRWKLEFVKGEAGGFILSTDLYAGILAEADVAVSQLGPAFFEMQDVAERAFIIKLVSDDQIALAREILSGNETQRVRIQGSIVKEAAAYNPGWSFHLDPTTIDFFEFAIEVCDSESVYVEENLEDVGGAFLPNNHWCPWTSKLVCEIPYGGIAKPVVDQSR
ncbi:MAG: hypothetical protein AAFN27_10025 [Pseudomonadota bacterium]